MSQKNIVKNAENIKSEEVEKFLYGYHDAADDPFKNLKISDAIPLEKYMTYICSAKNVKRVVYKDGVPVDMEVIPENIEFRADLSINCINEGENFFENIKDIRKACNSFYLKILHSEKSMMMNIYHVSEAYFTSLEKAAEKANSFIVRVGKHSGAESVTIDGLRSIKIKQGKGKSIFLDHSTTYWLADFGDKFLRPFGWCVVTFEQVV